MTSVSRPAALEGELEELGAAGLRRTLRVTVRPSSATSEMDGRRVINFGSNNYLGLATHPKVISAAERALRGEGAGAGGSRLITGNHAIIVELETRLAELKGSASALVFSSGYLANLGAIASLVARDDVVFCDRLNHASLVDGCRISGAKVLVYPHNETQRLQEILARHRKRFRRALIVTDGLFSMDGDVADVGNLLSLARKFDAWLLVDDAHATGVLGSEGRGTLEAAGVEVDERVIQMGTLSKAMGSSGGYIAGPQSLRDYLINRARTFMFETALAPSAAAAALAAMRVMREESWRRERLRTVSKRVRSALAGSGLNVPDGDSPIVPVIAGANERSVRWMQRLFESGIYVPAVRPPAVPAGEARLRISLQCDHEDGQVGALVEGCLSAAKEDG